MDAHHPPRQCVHKVHTIPTRHSLLECFEKQGNMWPYEAENRLQGCIGLVAAEAINFTIMT